MVYVIEEIKAAALWLINVETIFRNQKYLNLLATRLTVRGGSYSPVRQVKSGEKIMQKVLPRDAMRSDGPQT